MLSFFGSKYDGFWSKVNLIVCMIAAIHLMFATIYDAFLLNVPRELLNKGMDVGGKLIYMTFWNESIETLYFCFAVVENIMSGCTDKETKPLRKIRDYWFTSIVFPLSAFVSVTFWALWAVDRELVMPKNIDPYFPTWLNHSVHTCILLYSFIELFTTYHRTHPNSLKQCFGLWTVTVTYLIWCVIVYLKCDMWVYPILEKLNWPAKITFFGSCLGLATGFLFGGVYLNNFVWKDKIQVESKKRS